VGVGAEDAIVEAGATVVMTAKAVVGWAVVREADLPAEERRWGRCPDVRNRRVDERSTRN
jgi:hypothetical protein